MMTNHSLHKFVTAAVTALLLSTTPRLFAAPGQLVDIPTFLNQPVQANVMILTDDSGSMDWEVLNANGDQGFLDFTPDNNTERRWLCPARNLLMYDPRLKYTPWKGTDRFGNPFTNQPGGLTDRVQENPYLASTGSCSGHGGQNTFSFGNGPNNGRCRLDNQIGPRVSGHFLGAFYYQLNAAGTDCSINNNNRQFYDAMPDMSESDFNNCIAPNCHSRINFANWFSYYRKREYVAKRALSEVLNENEHRVGLATINQNNAISTRSSVALPDGTTYNEINEVGTEVADIDDISLPEHPGAANNKVKLLRNLHRIDSNNGTPLRSGLNNVGNYFLNGNAIGSGLFDFTPTGGSPILTLAEGGECQKNYAVVMSDGFWNTDTWTTSSGNSGPIGNRDNDGGSGNDDSPFDGQSYADNFPNTLADVAMKFYEMDLAPLLEDKVSESDDPVNPDTNTAQHMSTFTVAFGVDGTLSADPTDASAAFNWPRPTANDPETIDDMRHAAWNGRGKFLSARNTDSLIASLNDIFSSIDERNTAAATSVAFQSSNLTAGGRVYQSTFNSGDWSGNITANTVDLVTNDLVEIWSASTQLRAQVESGTPARQIITKKSGGLAAQDGIPFRFPADYTSPTSSELNSAQIGDLLSNAPTGADLQTYGESITGWLRGLGTHEEGHSVSGVSWEFRNRGAGLARKLIGDIVNAAPLLIGNPVPGRYPDSIEPTATPSYSSYATTTRTPVVYVAANDGMLHGFNADTGDEIFAYIPEFLFNASNGINELADPDYDLDHRFYLDGSPVAADIYIDFDRLGGTGDEEWGTLLVGTSRAGGRGLYALNISNPGNLTEANAASVPLWEITNQTAGFANLGYTFSRPTIAKLHNGQWGVIFGNGYNADGGSGEGVLYIVNAETGDKIAEIPTTGQGTIDANTGDCLNVNSNCNGLSTVAVVDLDFNGIADRVYAGDVLGNLWSFDITGASGNAWETAGAKRLFIAQDDSSQIQAITGQPAVTFHPTERGPVTDPNLMVMFGTGEFVSVNAENDPATHSFYGIWDIGPPATTTTPKTDPILRSDLVRQTITTQQLAVGDPTPVRTQTNELVNYQDKSGWFMDLPVPGERVIVNPLVLGSVVAFVTTIPDGNLCDSAGASWLMAANILNGGNPDFPVFDANGDGVFDGADGPSPDKPASGVYSSVLNHQPSVAGSIDDTTGLILLPQDSEQDPINLERFQFQDQTAARSSWTQIKQ